MALLVSPPGQMDADDEENEEEEVDVSRLRPPQPLSSQLVHRVGDTVEARTDGIFWQAVVISVVGSGADALVSNTRYTVKHGASLCLGARSARNATRAWPRREHAGVV